MRRLWVVGLAIWAVMVVPVLSLAASGPVLDLNPDRWTNLRSSGAGRIVGIVIDPADADRAYALAYTGGLYRTTQARSVAPDWSRWIGRWAGDRNLDGTPGPVGRGLDRGLTSFAALAIDPANSRNLLLLANDDNRPPSTTLAGVWRSTDAGATWNPAANGSPPCASSMNYSGGAGHLVFSPSRSGLVVATSPCRLGVSRDGGASWSWTPFPNADPNQSVDSVAVTATNGVVFCGRSSPTSGLYVAYWPGGPIFSDIQYAGPPVDAGGACALSVNPRNWNDVFLATHGGSRNTLYEGRREAFSGITWTDLKPPQFTGVNAREVLVQTHTNGNSLRIFYHDTVYFHYKDCPPDGGCAVPATVPHTCPAEPAPATIWRCLELHHADPTEIAFDPSRSDACALLVANDGGVTLERQCGRIAGSTLGDNSVSMSAGLHAAEPWEFAATGAVTKGTGPLGFVDGRTLGMALQDNDSIVSDKGANSWQSLLGVCLGDGLSIDMLGAAGETSCNGNNVLFPDVAKPNVFSPVPAPSGTPVITDPAYFGWEGRFADSKTFVTATVTAGKLQLEAYSPSTGMWKAYGAATPSKLGTFGASTAGMLAIGNRRNSTNGAAPTFWVIAPRAPPGTGQRLACYTAGTGWRSSNLENPAAVWASEGEAYWSIAYETGGSKPGVYASRNGLCSFKRDAAASSLVTAGGGYIGSFDAAAWRNPNLPISAVGFDPNRPGVALIGSRHAGIAATANYGANWFASHAFPEPNGGIVGFDFANSVLPGPAGDIVVGAARGRGAWAFRVFGDIIRRAIPVRAVVVLPRSYKARVPLTCSAKRRQSCKGSLSLRLYRTSRGRVHLLVLGRSTFSIRSGRRQLVLVQLNRAARRLHLGRRTRVEVRIDTRLSRRNVAHARGTITLIRRR